MYARPFFDYPLTTFLGKAWQTLAISDYMFLRVWQQNALLIDDKIVY